MGVDYHPSDPTTGKWAAGSSTGSRVLLLWRLMVVQGLDFRVLGLGAWKSFSSGLGRHICGAGVEGLRGSEPQYL